MGKGKLRDWYAEIAVRYNDGETEKIVADTHCVRIKAKNIISAAAKANEEAKKLITPDGPFFGEAIMEASVWSVELADYEDDDEAYFDGYTGRE